MALIGNPTGGLTIRPPSPKAKPAAPNPLGGIIADPNVVLAGLARNQAQQGANALLRQQRSQALIGFGSPSLASSLGASVDPNTAAAAGANQFSTLAGLAHQQDLARRSILNSLAARGLAHSGDVGYQQGELARNYGQAVYDAQSALLGQLNDQLGSYLGSYQGANNDYLNAILGSYNTLLSNPLGLVNG